MTRIVCPLSNQPIDTRILGRNAIQLGSPHGRWYSTLFKSYDEAEKWKETFNILEAIPTATEEFKDGKVRLRGAKWYTVYMTSEELEAWRPVPKQSRRRRTNAEIEDANKSTGS